LSTLEFNDNHSSDAWKAFVAKFTLNQMQQAQFKRYLNLLVTWNERMNLTAITEPAHIISYHFYDSIILGQHIDLTKVQNVCDIGTGAGFPGIPLKICYPHLSTTLIEVTQKKIQFLEMIIAELQLDDILVFPYDWRTFLRKTDFAMEYFLVRASLKPVELIRMFKPASPYKRAILVYWASSGWEADQKERPFLSKEIPYEVGNKNRKLVFFKLKSEN